MRKNLLWTFTAAVLVSFAGCGSREVGMVVVYEVDKSLPTPPPPEGESPDAQIQEEMQRLIKAIDMRLNAGRDTGRVRQLDHGRIEVSIFRTDPDSMQRIADLLPRPGTLEFRILANDRDKRHKRAIEQGRLTDAGTVMSADGAEILGWWIPVDERSKDSISAYQKIATRTVTIENRKVLEVLVVNDPFNVTGAYLRRAVADVDDRGKPCVACAFNSTGARRFGGLTDSNLPDPDQDVHQILGIILDGKLISAPLIAGKVSKGGQISGHFSQEEVEDLAHLLNLGTLPTAIRKVEQRVVDVGKQHSP